MTRRLVLTAVAALALGGCFRTESKKVALLAGAEESGPRAFSLNTPLVAARGEPVALSWSPSTGATAYEARVGLDPTCAAPAFEQLGVVGPNVAVPGLAEGAWHLCVTAKDDDGGRRAAANDGARFLVDRTAPVATVTAPPKLAGARASFVLGGEGVTTIAYKAGPTATAACADAAGYSNAIDARAVLEVTLTGDARDWTLCLLAEDAAGNRQGLAAATAYAFAADVDLQTFSVDIPAVASGSSLVVKGTAPAAWTSIGAVTVSLRNTATGECFSSASAAFDVPCPHPLPVSGTSAWTVTIPGAAFSDGDTYELAARAVDTASGETVDAGTTNFAWRFDAVLLTGEGSRFAHAAVKDAAGSLVIAGTVEGSLDLGTVKIQKTAPAKGDWLVVKRLASGVTAWAKRFEGPAYDHVYMVAVDAAGDVYALAEADGAITIGTTTHPHAGETDVYLLKLAGATGAPLWVRPLASTASDASGGLVLDATGRPVIALRHCAPMDFGDGAPLANTSCDITLAAFSADAGAPLWKRNLASTWIAEPTALARGTDGALYLSGRFEKKLTIGTTVLEAAPDDGDGFVAAFSAEGVPQWAKALAGPGQQGIRGVTPIAAGLLLTGAAGDGASLAGTTLADSGAAVTLFVAKLSLDGSAVAWHQTAAGADGTLAFDVASDGTGGAIVVWRAKDSLTIAGQAVSLQGDDDLVLARFAGADGALVEAQAFGSKGTDVVGRPRISLAADGELVIAATYGSDLSLGNRTLPWPNGFGALVLRHRP